MVTAQSLRPRIVSLATALWLLGALLASGAAAQSLTYGPLLGRGATADQMIVHWGTDGGMDTTTLAYRKQGDPSWQTAQGDPSRDHEVVLGGLSLGTRYEYEVRSLAGAPVGATFSTCPQPGRPMDFVYYGDSRSGPSEHARIVQQVNRRTPDMVFESGDIVPDGAYTGYLSEFFPVVKDLARTTPFMAAPGNHDAHSNLATNYGLVFPSPRAAGAPWQSYYSFICGNVLFIALDSNSIGDAAQLQFLTGRLAAGRSDATIDHVFVWLHHAPYSIGEHGDNAAVQSTWVPLFNQPGNKVTAVFAGHDHLYARMNDRSGVRYIVSGGAGAGLDGQAQPSRASAEAYKLAFNFVAVHVVGVGMSAVVYDDTGTELDRFNNQGRITPGGAVDGADAGADPALSSAASGCTSAATGGGAPERMLPAGGLLLLAISLCHACARRRTRALARRPDPRVPLSGGKLPPAP